MPTAQTVLEELRVEAVKRLLFNVYTKIADVEFEIEDCKSAIASIEKDEAPDELKQKILAERNADLERATKDLENFNRNAKVLETIFVKYSKTDARPTTVKRKL